MAITAHYVDNHSILQGRFLSFLYVFALHTSEKLATVLHSCLMTWNVDCKLSTITLDNCSRNDVLIKMIKRKLFLSELLMNGSLLQMRCSTHVLNLIVKDGLDIIKGGIEEIRDSVSYKMQLLRELSSLKSLLSIEMLILVQNLLYTVLLGEIRHSKCLNMLLYTKMSSLIEVWENLPTLDCLAVTIGCLLLLFAKISRSLKQFMSFFL
ncbi:Putative AC transposase [Linum grandiflorum]